jgi:hypothetical protein
MPGDPFAPRPHRPLPAPHFIRLWPAALALAACSSSPGAADVEQAWLCGDLPAARPLVYVRNLSCRPAAGDRVACEYEAVIGSREHARPWVRVRGEFRRYSGTGAWCFDTRPAVLPENVAR